MNRPQPQPANHSISDSGSDSGRDSGGEAGHRIGGVTIYEGDAEEVLAGLTPASFDLIYIDPPFNTGRTQSRQRLKTTRDATGDRIGFKGNRYRSEILDEMGYQDSFTDYAQFLKPKLARAYDLLTPTGALFFHIDYREAHYCKVMLDEIFGRGCFMNEIIWAYDYGARSQKKWSAKHDTIFWYVKNPSNYTYNYDAIDRIPYMAPALVGAEKAARGKTPTDVWWQTIVSPTGKEKTGYPTQKPLAILERIIAVHSHTGDKVLDFFAGSGTTGVAAAKLGRHATLIDSNPEAVQVMHNRLATIQGQCH
ncbi:MAG: site-specific DNA-methyltransferase [Proteobacteria bacterium]|nr:site-specific DNA-methyltransferase [Pseudomonadota bacterium]